MNESMNDLKNIYFWDEFREMVFRIQGYSDEIFKSLALNMKELIMSSSQKDPCKMFLEVIEHSKEKWDFEASFPFHGDWHHFLVPGVILASLRNNGYEIRDKDIAEGIQRGAQAKVSCGFTGICGGANSIGVVGAVIKKTTPLQDDERQEIMQQAAHVLREISQIKSRCCKRSSYITLKETITYLSGLNYLLPDTVLYCTFSDENSQCVGSRCPFYEH